MKFGQRSWPVAPIQSCSRIPPATYPRISLVYWLSLLPPPALLLTKRAETQKAVSVALGTLLTNDAGTTGLKSKGFCFVMSSWTDISIRCIPYGECRAMPLSLLVLLELPVTVFDYCTLQMSFLQHGQPAAKHLVPVTVRPTSQISLNSKCLPQKSQTPSPFFLQLLY